MISTNSLIKKFFMLKRRQIDVEIKDAPECILEDIKKSMKRVLNDLLQRGIDGEEYLDTSKGVAAFGMFCSEEEHWDKISDRCGRCSHYFLKEKVDGCEKSIFSDVTPKPVLCSLYSDCGYDFSERLQMCISNCFKCTLHKQNPWGGECSENHNTVDINCAFRKEI